MKGFRKRSTWIILTILLLPVLLFGLWFRREVKQQQLDRALIQAIKKNEISTALALLNQGADSNTVDRPYRPVTFSGLLRDFLNCLRGKRPPPDTKEYPSALKLVYGPVYFLLPDTSLQEVLNTREDAPEPPDFDANKQKPANLIHAMLEHGARVDTKDKIGNILLGYACICHDAETVKLLLQYRVDPNANGAAGFLPLMCTQDYECARLLLEAGADANGRAAGGRTRLMFIYNTKLYPLLLKYGADLNTQDSDGQTALMRLFLTHYLNDDHIYTGMRFLLEHGAKVSLKDKQGKTAWDYAKAGKDNWMVENPHKGKYDKEIFKRMGEAFRKEQTKH